jgi:outer membrane autotransporter protein
MSKSPIVVTERCPWEFYASVFYATEDYDQQTYAGPNIPGTPFGGPVIVRPDTDISTLGGWLGIDYDLTDNWTLGFALSGSNSDVNMSLLGTADIDALALIPYISYYKDLGSFAVWADLLYAYGMTEYTTLRLPSVIGDTDGDFNNLEFNTGLNLTNGPLVHGPFGQLRWLDGDIDGYQELGLGGVRVPDQSYESLATQLGYQISYHIDTASGMKVVPNASVAWEHEFKEDQGTLFGLPLGEVDEDLLVVGAGIGCYNGCGWNLSLDYEGRFGSEVEGHYVGAKFGFEF